MRKLRIFLSAAASVALLFCASVGSAEDAKQASGTFKMESKSIAVGIGVSWGTGMLSYKGNEYPFKISGLSVVDVGVTAASVSGEVYDLTKIEDFPGQYMAGTAEIALAGGVGGVKAKNANDVIIRANSTSKGVKLALGTEGFTITMAD